MKSLILVFTFLSVFAFASEDPNLAKDATKNEGCTFALGTNPEECVRVCKACQNRNNLKLSDKKDAATPETAKVTTPSTTQDGKGRK
jgi:hypothetical protein